MPEFIDPVFAKTSAKRSFQACFRENWVYRFWHMNLFCQPCSLASRYDIWGCGTSPSGWEAITGLLKRFTNTGSDLARVKVEKLVVVDLAAVFFHASGLFLFPPVSCH